jgi:hypothetical protein
VALLHAEAGRDPFDKGLSDLIGELSTRSEEFRRRWAQRNVRLHRTGAKTFQHPAVGRLDLHFNGLELTATPGLTMFTYTAEPGSPSADGLRLLASWAATAAESSGPPENAVPDESTAPDSTTAVDLNRGHVRQPGRGQA